MSLLPLAALASVGALSAQDTLLYRNGTERVGTIVEDGPYVIGFKRVDQLRGPTYRVKLDRLREVRYADGRRRLIDEDAISSQLERRNDASTRDAGLDTLVFRDGTLGIGAVLAERGSRIVYRPVDQPGSRHLSVSREGVREVRYADGRHIGDVGALPSAAASAAAAPKASYLNLQPRTFANAYRIGGERVTRREFEEKLAEAPDAYRAYQRGRSNVIAADLVGAVPAGLLGYQLGRLITTQEANYAVLLSATIVTAGTVAWRAAGSRRRSRAVAQANAALLPEASSATESGD